MKYKVAVIGAGIIGLTSAVRIQDHLKNQIEICLYTAIKSPNTTGDVSAGLWMPYLLEDTPSEKISEWAKESQEHFLKLWRNGFASECGLSLVPVVCLSKEYDNLPDWFGISIGGYKLTDEQVTKYAQFHQRKYIGGFNFLAFTCEPSKFLPYLERTFISKGGQVVIREIKSLSELKHYDLIVNCTGLGAQHLNSDNYMNPIRGQIARVEAPWQLHVEVDDSDDGHYIIPNQDCVILGGTHQEGNDSTVPTQSDKDFILNGCIGMVPSIKGAKILKHQVGLRPGRNSVKLELESRRFGEETVQMIHNYGHGGSGVTLCYGCAEEVAKLATQALTKIKKSKL